MRLLPLEAAHPSALLLSSIVESQLDPTVRMNGVPSDQMITTRRLADLSLDGLFKTIWFLGQILPAVHAGKTIRGRERPTPEAALKIAIRAFDFLASWPTAFLSTLDEIATRRVSVNSEVYFSQIFGSVHRYLNSELSEPETSFLKAAYEQQVRQIWRHSANRRPLRKFEHQLELNFGPDRD